MPSRWARSSIRESPGLQNHEMPVRIGSRPPCPPVPEMENGIALQAVDHFGLTGSSPVRGIPPSENRVDNSIL